MLESSASKRPAFDVAAFIDGRRLSPFNYKLIALSWLITFFDGLDMMVISFTAPYMAETMNLDTMMLGNVFSAGLLGMMLGGFVFAYVGDRIGRRLTIIVAAYSFGVLTLLTAFAETYEQLLFIRFLDGLAIGGMLPLAWALNIEFVPKSLRSTTVTLIMMGYSLGSGMAGPLTNLIAPEHGWPGVLLVAGAATILCAVALSFGLPESVRFLVSRQLNPGLVARTLKRVDPQASFTGAETFILGDEPTQKRAFTVDQLFAGRLRAITPLLWLGYTVSTLAVFLKASWGPIVLEEAGVLRQTAAIVGSISSVAGAVVGLILMRFTDRKGAFAVAVIPLLSTPFLLFMGLVPLEQGAFIALSLISSTLVAGGHFGILSIAGIYYPSAIRANGAGWAASIAKTGGVVGPILAGLFLASGMPVIHIFALLAICPIVLSLSAVGIGFMTREEKERVTDARTHA